MKFNCIKDNKNILTTLNRLKLIIESIKKIKKIKINKNHDDYLMSYWHLWGKVVLESSFILSGRKNNSSFHLDCKEDSFSPQNLGRTRI